MLGRQSLFAGTFSLGIAQLLALGLGVVQFTCFLYFFGSTARTDALIIAQTVPYFLSLLFNQALAQISIPILIHLREQEGEPELWRCATAVFSLSVCSLLLVGAVVVFAAPQIVGVLAPGFDAHDRQLAASLLRWMTPVMIVSGLCGAPRSIYFAYRAYTAPAIASLFPSLGILGGMLLLRDQLGIYSFVAGGIAGALLQLLVLLLLLNVGERRLVYHWTPWHRGLQDFFRLMGARVVILGLNNVNAAVDRGFASTLGAASVSALGYAHTMADAPMIWLRSTFGVTIIPVLSSDIARHDAESFTMRIGRYLGLSAFLMVPVTVLIIALALPLVQTFLQRGAFRAGDAVLVSTTLVCYTIGLVPGAAGAVLAAGLLSLKDALDPLIVSCVLMVLNFVLNLLLIQGMGLGGLALATSLVLMIRLVLLTIVLQRKMGPLRISRIGYALARTGMAGVGMALMVVLLAHYLNVYGSASNSFLERLLPLAATCLVGGFVYVLLCRWLNVPEATLLLKRLRRFAGRRLGGSLTY